MCVADGLIAVERPCFGRSSCLFWNFNIYHDINVQLDSDGQLDVRYQRARPTGAIWVQKKLGLLDYARAPITVTVASSHIWPSRHFPAVLGALVSLM